MTVTRSRARTPLAALGKLTALGVVGIGLALMVVMYYQRRNHAAYFSHRKRTLARLAEFGYLAP